METFGGTALDVLFEWTRASSSEEKRRVALASIPTLLRAGAGARAIGDLGPRPGELLVLYQREGCPFSRRVREALSMLDLDALIKPVPEGSSRHAREVEALTGAREIPVLVDPTIGVVVQETAAILAHLFQHYGRGRVPLRLRLHATSRLASRARADRGSHGRRSIAPSKALELTGYEASPATRLVRERLDELELPYVSRALAPHSARRRAFFAREGTLELPFLHDCAAGVRLFGAASIVAYVERTYALDERRARELSAPVPRAASRRAPASGEERASGMERAP